MLNVIPPEDGSGGDNLLIAHGLFGSARNWNAVRKRLSDAYRVTTVDMRNHGESFRADTQSYEDMAGDLAEVIGEPCHVVGHSMGGKAAMVLALNHPEKLKKIVIADIAPVAYTHTQIELVEAMRGVDLAGLRTRSEADARLAETVDNQGVRAFLLQSLDLREGRWKLNLDVLGREMEKIIGFPQVSGTFEGEALFLSGGESDYVLREHRDRIKSLFPNAKFASIPGAGHWLHAEKPREFEAALRAFLG